MTLKSFLTSFPWSHILGLSQDVLPNLRAAVSLAHMAYVETWKLAKALEWSYCTAPKNWNPQA